MRGSPLMASGIVLAGIALLAVPLRRLTQGTALEIGAPVDALIIADAESTTPAILRVRLLAPARSLRITNSEGLVLWDASNLPAGEAEHDVVLTGFSGALDLHADADFGTLSGETALFLTVMPDGREVKQAHAIGGPIISAPLHFDWPH